MCSFAPLVILSDVHFSHHRSIETGRSLARLITQHPGHEIVLAGDIFNLSCDDAARDPVESVLEMLRPHGELRSALHVHLAGGGRVTLLSGNHDAATMKPELRPALLSLLELDERARLDNLPWFIRRGSVHIEHGHAYDPDNAPTHPLFYGGAQNEPLGVALTRRFLAPNQAFDFAHEHETTPLNALIKAFRLFGVSTPLLLARYFGTASALCFEAAMKRGTSEAQHQGEARVPGYAEKAEVTESTLRALLGALPRPTNESASETFFRLYFDRVAATLLTLGGSSAGLILRKRWLMALGFLGAGYLVGSVRKSTNRYGELPVERLREAASVVRDLTAASLVVFGHIHLEDTAPGYINSASFTYREGPGRPYLLIEQDGVAQRRRIGAEP